MTRLLRVVVAGLGHMGRQPCAGYGANPSFEIAALVLYVVFSRQLIGITSGAVK